MYSFFNAVALKSSLRIEGMTKGDSQLTASAFCRYEQLGGKTFEVSGGKLLVGSEKMEKKGLASVVTGEGPRLKTNNLGSRRLVYCLILQNLRDAPIHEKWKLESEPRGRQKI